MASRSQEASKKIVSPLMFSISTNSDDMMMLPHTAQRGSLVTKRLWSGRADRRKAVGPAAACCEFLEKQPPPPLALAPRYAPFSPHPLRSRHSQPIIAELATTRRVSACAAQGEGKGRGGGGPPGVATPRSRRLLRRLPAADT